MLAERRKFEIDQYYESLKKFTFETKFVDLTEEEVKAWRTFNRGGTMTDDEQKKLDAIKCFPGDCADTFFHDFLERSHVLCILLLR